MKLKICLTPLSPFFFGGETTYNVGARGARGRRQTYVTHSRFFPQQTGMLGLIRNQLLLQSGLLRDNSQSVSDKAVAKQLIGKHGFRLSGSENDFGIIKKLSPMYLKSNDGHLCWPAPLDDRLIPDGDEELEMSFAAEEINGQDKGRLIGYREKEGLKAAIQHPNDKNAFIDDLVTDQKEVGITKAAKPWGEKRKYSEEDQAAGFFFQTKKHFKQEENPFGEPDDDSKEPPAFHIKSFVFYVEIDENLADKIWKDHPINKNKKFSLDNDIVEFGGERSTFWMEVETVDDFLEPNISYVHRTEETLDSSICRLVCVSPCWVEKLEKLREKSRLIISSSISFRFLQSTVEDTTKHQMKGDSKNNSNKKYKGMLESEQFQLLDRGTVIYFDKSNLECIEAFFKNESLEQIGYNHYRFLCSDDLNNDKETDTDEKN